MYKSDYINEIHSRGFIHQASDINSLDLLMKKNKIVGYIGFDPTNNDLHIGSLMQLMLLSWMEYFDHSPILLMGGGTTLVGDPSGKDTTRKIMNIDQVHYGNTLNLSARHLKEQ